NDGMRGELVGASMPTDERGAYHLDLGSFHGPLLLVARGAGGKYTEPATGVVAHWDPTTELRAAFVARSNGEELRFDLESGETATAILSPWSEWTVASASARLATKKDATYADALNHATDEFRGILELDAWSVVPADLAGGAVGAWNDAVQAGLLL